MKGEVQLESSIGQTPSDSDPLLENQPDSSHETSDEIKNEDTEAGSIPCCRICLESDAEPGEFHRSFVQVIALLNFSFIESWRVIPLFSPLDYNSTSIIVTRIEDPFQIILNPCFCWKVNFVWSLMTAQSCKFCFHSCWGNTFFHLAQMQFSILQKMN